VTCSFCKRAVGEGTLDKLIALQDSMDVKVVGGKEIDFKELAERLRKHPNRRVKLLLPGPGDIRICDICVDLYSDAVRRELAARE